MEKTKMKLNIEVAKDLMDTLAAIWISANGGAPLDENGECLYTDEDMEIINSYARNKFREIMDAWEDEEHEWDIVESFD